MDSRIKALLAQVLLCLLAACGGGGGGGDDSVALPSLSGTYQLDATVDVLMPSSVRVSVAGLNASLSCRNVSGQVPAGMNLSSDCSLSGVPNAVGTSEFRVEATASGYSGKALVDVRVGVAGPTGTQIHLGQLSWDQTVPAGASILIGGLRPQQGDVWRHVVSTGRLPRGVEIEESTGVIRGRALEAGSFSFSVTSSLQRPGGVLSLSPATTTVEVQPPVFAPEWTGSVAYYTPMPIRVNAASFSPPLPNGARPSFELLTALPAGLSLDPSTGAISGQTRGGGLWEGQVRISLTSETGATFTGSPRTLRLPLFGPYQLYGHAAEDPSLAREPRRGVVITQPGSSRTMEPSLVAGGLAGDVYRYELLPPFPDTGAAVPTGWLSINADTGRVVITVPNDQSLAFRSGAFRIRLTTSRNGQQYVSDAQWMVDVLP